MKTSGFTLLALALVFLVTTASDEGGVPWDERAGRTLPLTPFCGAVGVLMALARPRVRGGVIALQALGRSPAQIAAASVVGATLVPVFAGIGFLAIPGVDVAAFYPTATRAAAWTWKNCGFDDAARGIRVGIEGAPVRFAIAVGYARHSHLPEHGRMAAALAVASAGLGLAALVARVLVNLRTTALVRKAADTSAALLTAAATTALFQGAAAHRVPALAAVVPSLGLLALVVARYRTDR